MSKGADLERRFGRNLYESLGARRKDDANGAGEGVDHAAGNGNGSGIGTGNGAAGAGAVVASGAASPADGRTRLREAGVMELSRITPDPDQPRKHFQADAISRLAASLKAHGQLQPIRVRWSEPLGKWLIIAGERRYRASLEAGLATIQCIFVEKDEDSSLWLAEQMVENCLREDLTPVEQAIAFDRLMKTQGWSARKLAEELHVSPGSVSKALALLNLPDDLRQAVDSGAISSTAGYELARVSDPDQRREIADLLLKKEIKRDDLAGFNRNVSQTPTPSPTTPTSNPNSEQAPAPSGAAETATDPKAKPRTPPTLTAKAQAKADEAKAKAAVEAEILASLKSKTEPVFTDETQAKGEGATESASDSSSGSKTGAGGAKTPHQSVRRYLMRNGAEIRVHIPKSNANDVDFYDSLLFLVSGLKALGTGTPKGKFVAETVISEIIQDR